MQIGINFADVFTCLGLYQAAPKENVIPGLEVLTAQHQIICLLHNLMLLFSSFGHALIVGPVPKSFAASLQV
jgi:hypothetical protein